MRAISISSATRHVAEESIFFELTEAGHFQVQGSGFSHQGLGQSREKLCIELEEGHVKTLEKRTLADGDVDELRDIVARMRPATADRKTLQMGQFKSEVLAH